MPEVLREVTRGATQPLNGYDAAHFVTGTQKIRFFAARYELLRQASSNKHHLLDMTMCAWSVVELRS